MTRLQSLILCAAVSACGANTGDDATRASSPGVAAPADAAPASAPGGALTVTELVADLDARLGETVTLTAQYLNTNSVQLRGEWTVQNIILVESRERNQPRVTCMLVEDSKPGVKRIKQYTPLVVEGKVGRGGTGRLKLDDCKILSR